LKHETFETISRFFYMKEGILLKKKQQNLACVVINYHHFVSFGTMMIKQNYT